MPFPEERMETRGGQELLNNNGRERKNRPGLKEKAPQDMFAGP